MSFPFYQQPDYMDCGPTCLRMVARYHGRAVALDELRKRSETTRTGSNLQSIADAAESLGFRSLGVKVSLQKLLEEEPFPCILHWNSSHFVVLHKGSGAKRRSPLSYFSLSSGEGRACLPDRQGEAREGPGVRLHVADPAHGLLTYTEAEFLELWIGKGARRDSKEGIALLLEPTPLFYAEKDDDKESRQGFRFLFRYLKPHRKFIVQLAIGLGAASMIQLLIPFLTQSVVDVGIQHRDIHFIWLVLFAQLFLYLGSTVIELVRGWILLHLSSRINIALISDFFIKLMKLPIGFFDSKQTGDILQRISDHNRIEQLLTTTSLSVLFSLFNIVLFGAVLAWYSLLIFAVFVVGSALYITWVLLFMKRRRDLDFKRFAQQGAEQSKVIELIQGMQEIKLHNAERQKRWGWEELQVKLFKVGVKGLALQQTQTIGGGLLNEVKNLFITIISAKLVIDGSITLGMMLSISYIIGQLNSPIQQLIGFSYTVQDARIALERLSEIHDRADESSVEGLVQEIAPDADIELDRVSFRYPGSAEPVIKDLDLVIPAKKTTAIVGSSGSGKTTLMKLLLKFYPPSEGSISYGPHNLATVDHSVWRGHCGVVMQEGFIFNDTVANNITIGHAAGSGEDGNRVDKDRLVHAATVANIHEFVSGLPLGYNTKIGGEGLGMSTGQKQRLLIARAVYKQPRVLLFDEATSALDASNERTIMDNLERFFQERTAVVIAHRLSTVKHADNIVVLDKGRIAEQGTHTELLLREGIYFTLVKDQLQLEKIGAEA